MGFRHYEFFFLGLGEKGFIVFGCVLINLSICVMIILLEYVIFDLERKTRDFKVLKNSAKWWNS